VDEEQKKKTAINLGKVNFGQNFMIEVARLELNGNLTASEPEIDENNELSEEEMNKGYIELVTDNLYIYNNVTLEAKHIFLYANNTIDLGEEVRLKSTIQNVCSFKKSGREKDEKPYHLYKCFSREDNIRSDNPITYQGLLDHYNK
jgi:hypothetical protein